MPFLRTLSVSVLAIGLLSAPLSAYAAGSDDSSGGLSSQSSKPSNPD